MSRVHLKIYIQELEQADYKIKKEKVYERYEFNVNGLNDFIDIYYLEVMKVMNDGVLFDYYDFLDVCYIDLGLIIINDGSNINIDQLVLKINKLTQKLISTLPEATEQIESDISNNLESEEGIILFLKAMGDFSIKEHELSKLFIERNLDYEWISHNHKNVDFGASGGSDDFLLFIAGSIMSGLTWDIIKYEIIDVIHESKMHFKTYFLDNRNFHKLRRKIQDRSKVSIDDLILTDLEEKDEGISLKFRSNKGFINVLCDKNYNIIKYKFKPTEIKKPKEEKDFD